MAFLNAAFRLVSTKKLVPRYIPCRKSRRLSQQALVLSRTKLGLQARECLWLSSSLPFAVSTTDPRFFSSLAQQKDDAQSQENEKQQTIIPFVLADIGEGIAEVELLQWYVQEGDQVAQFDRICEVQSDKATVEITSRYDGTISSLHGAVGDMIAVGSPLLHIAVVSDHDKNESSSEATSDKVEPLNNVDDTQDRLNIPSFETVYEMDSDNKRDSSSPSITDTSSSSSKRVLTTPAVRKLAMDYDLDLSNLVGTGPKGRILKADVIKILRDGGILDEDEKQQEMSTTTMTSTNKGATDVVEEDTVVEIKGYNRLMVKSMTASLKIPHMCYSDEIKMNALLQCRQELQPIAEQAHGIPKLSLLPFAMKAASLAINEFPVVNSTLNVEEYKVTYRANHNIGVAMDTPRGLAVPVVKDCQTLSIVEIAVELERLKKLAADGALTESDITDCTFTLSNIGAIGGTYMSPIVSSPQVAIGAMGKIQRLPRFVEDDSSYEVEECHIMQISWGGDHRVIDGATMARFSNRWKHYMESPMSMVFAMK